jgi:hypothetical protein
LKPGREISNRLSKEWIEIGFQGADPATDFRGVGILGLRQLLSICTESRYSEGALRMYQDSLNPDCWYFFAVTGLNITSKLIISLKSCGGLDTDRSRALSTNTTVVSATNSNAQMESTDPLALNQVLVDQFEAGLSGKLYDALTFVYFRIFQEFNRAWTSKKRTIMEFN